MLIAVEPPGVVRVEPGTFAYRVAGDFTSDGRSVNAPLVRMRIDYPLTIMKTQVSAADFDRCVADEACQPRDAGSGRPDLPAVGVSWLDATAYARWLSEKTGWHWRLPTDEEWSFAAGSRLKDDVLVADATGGFAERWLAEYDEEARRKSLGEKAPRPFGSFGANENGLLDIAGNVWEWTDTCFIRQALDERGTPEGAPTVNCGVHVVAGEHRSYISDFIRDARSGGCSVGTPPANLGFRLVREGPDEKGSLLSRLLARIRAGTGRPGFRPWHEWPRVE
ncbi:SUMF1/EgtB/PvdO family nonheme iron enzyme [Chelativorans sp. AA-79]|uniref:formylglycine-generating enzyme family protein n=1 Tax=Chelativorans sp. AA-79 TaxID=3028735 RepID=UPI0023FA3B9E|nr:SUMF1/EgtB/PvdO family nonheme iron enzyme [Chelativorans sp. AA-79]WEX08558.1 SUMF1/EgtB/PvdO family nonheme iron enzyme [Chelativorans sp. AA-79]